MIGMSGALLALGGSLLAAGMAIWLVLRSQAQARELRTSVAQRQTIKRNADDAAVRKSMLHDQRNTSYILGGQAGRSGLGTPLASFGVHRAD